MVCKLFSVVIGQGSDGIFNRFQAINDSIRYKIRGLVLDLRQNSITAFAFYQGYNGLFVAFANQCITFPMPDLATLFNMGRTLGNRSATNDLSSSLSAARIAFSPLFLTSKVVVKRAAERFIHIDMAVDRLMADRHLG